MLLYAIRDENGWRTEIVDDQARGASLAVDSQGRPHLAYSNVDGVKHAVRVNGGWKVELVDGQAGWPWYTEVSLALGERGEPHLAYVAGPWPTELRYAYHDGQDWQLETVDIGDKTGDLDIDGHALALDAKAVAHLSYTRFHDPYPSRRDLEYATRRDGVWKTEEVSRGSNESWGFHNSIAVDSDGQPWIAFDPGSAQVATRTPDGWKLDVVDTGGFGDPSIAIDDWGTVRIAYGSANRVVLATDRATAAVWGSQSASVREEVRAYPNPFRDSVTFQWTGRAQSPSLQIYDATGRLARVLPLPMTRVKWDGRDETGRPATPAIYFFRLEVGNEVRAGKITLAP